MSLDDWKNDDIINRYNQVPSQEKKELVKEHLMTTLFYYDVTMRPS